MLVKHDIESLRKVYGVGEAAWQKFIQPVFDIEMIGAPAISELGPNTTESNINISNMPHGSKTALPNETDLINQVGDISSQATSDSIDLISCDGCGECHNCQKACSRLIGQFVMLKTLPGNKYAKFYAARVLGSTPGSKDLSLSWFQGNIYENNEKPVSEGLSLPIGDVWDAYNDIFIKDDLASIKWPITLYDDAHDLFGYTNTAIAHALKEAQASIIGIVTSSGEHQHPILGDFKDWMGKESSQRLANSFQYDYFTYDLLPGDRSLSAETAVLLSNALPTSSFDFHLGGALAIMPVIRVLCDLVILRVYLG